jgi:hypothetical protein
MILNVRPETLQERQIYRTIRPPAESGMIHRRSVWEPWGGQLRQWVMGWEIASVAEKDAVKALWDQTYNGVLSMEYTPPNEAATVVRFVEDTFEWRLVTATSVAMTFTIEEVR